MVDSSAVVSPRCELASALGNLRQIRSRFPGSRISGLDRRGVRSRTDTRRSASGLKSSTRCTSSGHARKTCTGTANRGESDECVHPRRPCPSASCGPIRSRHADRRRGGMALVVVNVSVLAASSAWPTVRATNASAAPPPAKARVVKINRRLKGDRLALPGASEQVLEQWDSQQHKTYARPETTSRAHRRLYRYRSTTTPR